MFITLTIDTHQKQKGKIRMNKSNINPAAGWRKAVNVKKRSMWQKMKRWNRTVKVGTYRLDGQVAMF